jgi:hypothetical protein
MKINKDIAILYALFILEIGFHSLFKKWLPISINSMLASLSSFAIVWFAYKLIKNSKNYEAISPTTKASKPNKTKSFILVFALAIFTILFFQQFFLATPINIITSDIIPTTKDVYIERLFNNEFVYTPIHKGEYSWTPNYFPMHWLPFAISEYLNFDYRLMALLVLISSILFYSFHVISKTNENLNLWIKLLLPYLTLFAFHIDDKIIMGHTIETLICAYYLFFALSLLRNSTVAKAIGLSSILMSRFSIVLWTPFYIFSSFIQNKKQTIILSLISIFLALVIFVFPFIIKYPQLLTDSFDAFIPVYIKEWQGQSWQAAGDRPYQLFNGIGFANYFYSFWPGDLTQKITAFIQMQTIINISLPVLFFIYLRKFRKQISIQYYQLFTLKLTLIFFYSFIVVPYQYLFMVSIFVSIPIVISFDLISRREA